MVPHSRPLIIADDIAAVSAILESGMVAEGEEAAAFEAEVARSLGAAGAVATSSGTEALTLALLSLGIGPGDDVVIPTYTCPAVWHSVTQTGASPVLCDVGRDWVMTRDTVRAVLTPRTCAVVVVHTFGIVAPVAEIADLGVPVVEDCAHAYPGAMGPPHLARTGAFTVLSFHATKLLATGEGGMAVAMSDAKALERARALKSQDGWEGERRRSPLTDLQAALGRSQLARYPEFLRRRRSLAEEYYERLTPITGLPERIRERSIFFRFPLEVEQSVDVLIRRFAKRHVHVRRGVDTLLHRRACLDDDAFPGAVERFRRTLSIPLYPALSEKDVDTVCDAVLDVLSSRS